MNDEQTQIEGFAIVDLFGHQQIAGYVRTVTVGASGFLRCDVPEVDGMPAYTRFIGPGAVYALTLVTEEIVHAALRQIRPPAVTVYIPRQLPPCRGEEMDMEERAYVRDEDDEEDMLF